MKKNDVIDFPKRSNYAITVAEESEMYCINFQTAETPSLSPFTFHLKNADEVLGAYQRAEMAWRRRKNGVQMLCKAELYKILYESYRETNIPYIPESKTAILQPAVDYIHKKYTEELINVEKMSKLCGVSYEYFRKLFRQLYGCTPVKYINQLKLKRAKELLSSVFYSVSEAAFASGFSDVSHFSRFFKANVGVLPSEYR